MQIFLLLSSCGPLPTLVRGNSKFWFWNFEGAFRACVPHPSTSDIYWQSSLIIHPQFKSELYQNISFPKTCNFITEKGETLLDSKALCFYTTHFVVFKTRRKKDKSHLQGPAQKTPLLRCVASQYKMWFYKSPLPFEGDNDFALLIEQQMKVIQCMCRTQHVKSYCQSPSVFPGDLLWCPRRKTRENAT